ncbi:hypothetical protein N7462_000741 [Penicillium macrosclerotiorum]|uniref:uncharacterized protein n=1 Tax=Penicillium macrosclerotiorum TaxID=303699 RepID=UPI00254689F5|nr:uncharacterized protein N7462_000741 [Penicillium macrosclerotiorum]KAJ5698736.1 hypothetical protein N7462_000741 [Penicillium macrosclerotiorum]
MGARVVLPRAESTKRRAQRGIGEGEESLGRVTLMEWTKGVLRRGRAEGNFQSEAIKGSKEDDDLTEDEEEGKKAREKAVRDRRPAQAAALGGRSHRPNQISLV